MMYAIAGNGSNSAVSTIAATLLKHGAADSLLLMCADGVDVLSKCMLVDRTCVVDDFVSILIEDAIEKPQLRPVKNMWLNLGGSFPINAACI